MTYAEQTAREHLAWRMQSGYTAGEIKAEARLCRQVCDLPMRDISTLDDAMAAFEACAEVMLRAKWGSAA